MKTTLVIDNFNGTMTAFKKGDINSGRSYVVETSGNNPFFEPGSLTWSQPPSQIDPTGSVITDLILAGKERVESGVLYIYAIGHTGRVYKIQVNDPSGYNPDYDNPVLLTTITSGSPTFTRGGYIDFFGTTEKIYIGHDKGVTSLNFNGTGEAVVGVVGSWTQTVPRPLKQFLGNLYVGNGSNIAEISVGAVVTSYTKLSPGFPANTQVRDMDVSIDGNYLHVVVSELALFDITSATQDTTSSASARSFVFKWNGTDNGYTAYTTFPAYSIGANIMFQNYQYTFGSDQYGSAIYNPYEKTVSLQEVVCPLPNAISSTGNMLTWMSPLVYAGVLEVDLLMFGSLDFEIGPGYWDVFFMNATEPETDIIRVPCQIPISNFGVGSSSNGYTNTIYSTGKIYFSTLETSAAPTTQYRFYKWSPSPSLRFPNPALVGAVYQTQMQMFTKKVNISEVRIYGEPWEDGAAFTIDLIGSGDTPISGGTVNFNTTTNLTVGADYAWYNPNMTPTSALAVRFTNDGSVNHLIHRVELDIQDAGK